VAFSNDHAKIVEAIFRRFVGIVAADENVVTVSTIRRAKGRKPIPPIIPPLALVEAPGSGDRKLLTIIAIARANGQFNDTGAGGVQAVKDALTAMFDQNDTHFRYSIEKLMLF
jgi:hypothetical protein